MVYVSSFIAVLLCIFCYSTSTELYSKTNYILDDPKCRELKTHCNNVIESNDLLTLECLQSLDAHKLSSIQKPCQNVIWEHSNSILSNDHVRELLLPSCEKDLSVLKCSSLEEEYLIKCVINKRDNIQEERCLTLVDRLEGVIFQDFRVTHNFLKSCTQNIKALGCGLLDVAGFSQSETLNCLQNHIIALNGQCKKDFFELAEIQADNIKLDKQLYQACMADHIRFCQMFSPGSGRVLNCLMQQEPDKLTTACVNNLLRRQKLIVQDYKISKGLMRACREDIKKTHCRKQTSSDKTVRLAQILLCLEGVSKNNSKLDPDCLREMTHHRRMLMEDYRLSPEIVDDCKADIKNFCVGVETGGKTIHCLMDHLRLAKHHSRISDVCQKALENLVKETDVAEDWRVDPVLHGACFPVVQAVCKDVKSGDGRVISCLMDNIDADHMTEECEDALMQIQYFVSRDFQLDPQLYRACKGHAVDVCHADASWDNNEINGPSFGPQVLPCLYRYAYHEDKKLQLNKSCLQELRRVMRQRALSVDLLPEIEEPCLDDLSEFCMEKTKKGEEISCLQKNLNSLTKECKGAIESFTEDEAQHAELNPYIMTHCRKEMESICSAEMKNDEGDIMECLITHKNDPTVKANPPCRASIEHFQIISLDNYKFTYKFKMACKTHAMRFCVSARTKAEVITCLSERITNDTIRREKSVIPKECRQQLKAQLFQQREDINFDPKLKLACAKDIKTFCPLVEHGNSQVLECLQSVHKKLSDKCEKELFKVKKQEIGDNSVDYALMTMCADSIDQFCPHHEKETVLECLKMNKDARGFNKKCRLIVLHRMVEQNTNYQLNPSLQKNCNLDMNKFCKNVFSSKTKEKDINGPIITCLKNAFKHSKLTTKCEKEVVNILREQALDIDLNPLLKVVCKNELDTICLLTGDENAEECLKKALIEKKIATPQCQNEVANMIVESQADINVDPLLQQACALDILNFCVNIPQGSGRHIKCLKTVSAKKLSSDCREMLNKRLEMYRNAEQYAPPEDFQALYSQVIASPSKHYFFLVIFMLIGLIFLIGILCGRVSKRHMLIKNK